MAMNNITVLNTIWENSSLDYQSRVPQATKTNIQTVGNAILNYQSATNEFLSALVNRISLTIVSSKMAQNKLAKFKKGMVEYGADIEEIYTAMAQAQSFDVAASEDNLFKRVQPDVKSIFHRVNRQDFYKTTIQEGQIKRAFLSNDGLGKLVSSIVNSLYSGDTYDEYVHMKNLVARYFDPSVNNTTPSQFIALPKVQDESSAKALFRAIKQTSTDMTFMDTSFNAKGVMQRADKSEQVLLIHKNVDTYMNTDVLAYVFNKENIDIDTSVVVLDDFGSTPNIQAALVDKEWFQVYDKLFQTTNQYNAEGLYYNYWLHHHQTLSTSQFHNAVAFTIQSGTGV